MTQWVSPQCPPGSQVSSWHLPGPVATWGCPGQLDGRKNSASIYLDLNTTVREGGERGGDIPFQECLKELFLLIITVRYIFAWVSWHFKRIHSSLLEFTISPAPYTGLPWWLNGKESAYNAGDTGDSGSIPGQENPLKTEMAPHSNILAWKIPRTEEPGELHNP